jgi:hypothetical protein
MDAAGALPRSATRIGEWTNDDRTIAVNGSVAGSERQTHASAESDQEASKLRYSLQNACNNDDKHHGSGQRELLRPDICDADSSSSSRAFASNKSAAPQPALKN